MAEKMLSLRFCKVSSFHKRDLLNMEIIIFSGQITELKKQVNMLIAMGAMLEEQMTKEE